MLKILQARLQQYVNCEVMDVQAGFRKGRGTRDQIANICWIIKNAREFQKKYLLLLYGLCQSFWLYRWQQTVEIFFKFWKRWEYQTTWPASWEIYMQVKNVRTGHGTTGWFQIGKRVNQGCTLLPYLFNLDAEYITQNAGLDEAQVRIKIARWSINNLKYADDTTFMAESEEELKSLLMKVKEES